MKSFDLDFSVLSRRSKENCLPHALAQNRKRVHATFSRDYIGKSDSAVNTYGLSTFLWYEQKIQKRV